MSYFSQCLKLNKLFPRKYICLSHVRIISRTPWRQFWFPVIWLVKGIVNNSNFEAFIQYGDSLALKHVSGQMEIWWKQSKLLYVVTAINNSNTTRGGPWATPLTWEPFLINKQICSTKWFYHYIDLERKRKKIFFF